MQEHLERIDIVAPISRLSKNYSRRQGNEYELKSCIFFDDDDLRRKHACVIHERIKAFQFIQLSCRNIVSDRIEGTVVYHQLFPRFWTSESMAASHAMVWKNLPVFTVLSRVDELSMIRLLNIYNYKIINC